VIVVYPDEPLTRRIAMLRAVFAALMLAAVAFAAPRASSPDGKRTATADKDTITITTGQPPRILSKTTAHKDTITALAYSPDGKTLVSGDKAGKMNLIDGTTGKVLMALTGPAGITAVEVSADGKTITAKAGTTAKSFDVATGAEVKPGR
jgi:WD40 repeat protein